jgi:hypothetical protein
MANVTPKPNISLMPLTDSLANTTAAAAPPDRTVGWGKPQAAASRLLVLKVGSQEDAPDLNAPDLLGRHLSSAHLLFDLS